MAARRLQLNDCLSVVSMRRVTIMAEAPSRARADCCDTFDPSSSAARDALRDRLLDVAGLSGLFKVLGGETRTRILYLLSLKEPCVFHSAGVLEVSLPAVFLHLPPLRGHRLGQDRGGGNGVY